MQNQARDDRRKHRSPFAGDKATFLKAAGDSNREAPFYFGDLPDYRPDGTRSGRNNDSLPRLWLTDFEKTDKGSHPRHTEDAKRRRNRRRCRIELAQPGAIRNRVFLPTAIAKDDIANRVFWIARPDNLPDSAANHWLPDRSRRGIRFCSAHATPHDGSSER